MKQSTGGVRELPHSCVKASPHSTLSAQRRHDAAVEVPENMLRPLKRMEISTQPRLAKISATSWKR